MPAFATHSSRTSRIGYTLPDAPLQNSNFASAYASASCSDRTHVLIWHVQQRAHREHRAAGSIRAWTTQRGSSRARGAARSAPELQVVRAGFGALTMRRPRWERPISIADYCAMTGETQNAGAVTVARGVWAMSRKSHIGHGEEAAKGGQGGPRAKKVEDEGLGAEKWGVLKKVEVVDLGGDADEGWRKWYAHCGGCWV